MPSIFNGYSFVFIGFYFFVRINSLGEMTDIGNMVGDITRLYKRDRLMPEAVEVNCYVDYREWSDQRPVEKPFFGPFEVIPMKTGIRAFQGILDARWSLPSKF
jgi:hypothetical protein